MMVILLVFFFLFVFFLPIFARTVNLLVNIFSEENFANYFNGHFFSAEKFSNYFNWEKLTNLFPIASSIAYCYDECYLSWSISRVVTLITQETENDTYRIKAVRGNIPWRSEC